MFMKIIDLNAFILIKSVINKIFLSYLFGKVTFILCLDSFLI